MEIDIRSTLVWFPRLVHICEGEYKYISYNSMFTDTIEWLGHSFSNFLRILK